MKNKHRAASAKAAASTYAPMPSGSLLTFGFIGASVALVGLFLFANFYSLDLSGHVGLLAGGVVVEDLGGSLTARQWLGVAVMLAGLPLLLIGRSRVARADQSLGSVESTP